jgi:hypothetical protein
MGSAGGGDLDGAKLGDCEDSETVIEKFVASIGSPVIACGKSVEAGLNTRHALELWFGFGLGRREDCCRGRAKTGASNRGNGHPSMGL